MLWAAYCLGFFRFLRADEFTVNWTFDPTLHLTMADVQVDSFTNPHSFRVFIKCSKTDPFRKGCSIFLGLGSFPLCPVVSLTNYHHLRGHSSLQVSVVLSSFLQTSLQSAGIPGKFSGHSSQIGAATTAARKGLPDHLIKTMGHWSSRAHLLYVCTPVETILSVAGWLAKQVWAPPPFIWAAFLGAVGFGHFSLGLWLPRPWEPPFLQAMPSLLRGPLTWRGGSWLGCLDLPVMGVVSI